MSKLLIKIIVVEFKYWFQLTVRIWLWHLTFVQFSSYTCGIVIPKPKSPMSPKFTIRQVLDSEQLHNLDMFYEWNDADLKPWKDKVHEAIQELTFRYFFSVESCPCPELSTKHVTQTNYGKPGELTWSLSSRILAEISDMSLQCEWYQLTRRQCPFPLNNIRYSF